MNTLYINGRFLERPVTGVERVAHELLGALARDFLDDQGVLSIGSERWQLQLLAPADSKAASPWLNLPLRKVGRFTGHAWEQFSLPLLVRGSWLFSPCNTGPILKRRHIVYLHDAQPFARPENFSRSFAAWYRTMFRLLAHHAALVVANSRFTGRELQQHLSIPAHRLRICSPGAEHALRVDDSRPVRTDLPSAGFLLLVSSLNPNKNFAGVVRALELLGPAAPACVIAGQGNARVFGQVNLPADRVQTLGYVDDETLRELYRRAFALVYPSFYEGFGLPPLEAMANGCPVIVSATSAMPEVSGNAALYCEPSDPSSIAAAIRFLYRYPALREALVERGRKRAATFTWRRSAQDLVDALPMMVGAPGGKSSAVWDGSSQCA